MKNRSLSFFIAFLLFLCIHANGQSYLISTIAGTDSAGYKGDGGAATAARLNSPAGVAIDKNDNVYIADYKNNAIREVSTSGIIRTIAGNGSAGYTGDGGLATAAELNWPTAVAVDDSGSIYIADNMNNCIRKITTNGIINTIAGTGTGGYLGDGGPATAALLGYPQGIAFDTLGNIYFSDYLNSAVRKINTAGIITTIAGNGSQGFSGDGGPSTASQLRKPNGVAVDSYGNVYVVDGGNLRIRKISTSGIISTICGNGGYGSSSNGVAATTAQMELPTGLFIDKLNYMYVTDEALEEVRVINLSGDITTVAGNSISGYNGDGQIATAAELWNPSGIVFDPVTGAGYIADESNNRVRKLRLCKPEQPAPISGNNVVDTGKTYTYSVPPVPGAVSYTWMLPQGWKGSSTTNSINALVEGVRGDVKVVANGLCYPSDTQSMYVGVTLSFPTYKISTFAGDGKIGYTGDGGPATAAEIDQPDGITIDRAGNVYIADYAVSVIRKVSTTGIITTIAGNGQPGVSGDGGPATAAQLISPLQINVDRKGNLYYADSYDVIRKIDSKGIITRLAGSSYSGYTGDGGPATKADLFNPTCATPDTAGNVYIADEVNDVVRVVTPNDTINRAAGYPGTPGNYGIGGPAIDAELNDPVSVSVDDSNNYYIVVSSGAIYKVNAKKIINPVVNGGSINYSSTAPIGDSGYALQAIVPSAALVVDRIGNIYIADGSERIRMIDHSSGIINTIGGSGGAGGYTGDGGPATAAKFNGPSTITMDAKGRIYFTDEGNGVVRILSVCTPSVPDKVLGPPAICAGTKQTYSIIPVPGATSYTWTLPAGWSGASTDTAITVIAGTAGGDISVSAIGDTSCGGSSAPRTFAVKVSPSFPITIHTHDTLCYGLADTITAGGGISYIWSNGATTNRIIVNNPVSTVTYTVGINNGSCTMDTAITIHTSALPLSISPVLPAVCLGNSVTLMPDDSLSYTWAPVMGLSCTTCADPVASPSLTTTYTLNGVNKTGCKATDTVIVKVVSPATPKVTFTNPITVGTVDKLIASGGISYLWSNGKTTSSIYVKPDSTTSYWVIVDNNPCSYDTVFITVTVVSVLDLNNPALNKISCFPNPATTTTNIVFNTNGKHYLEVDDVTGRKIESIECSGKQYELSVRGFAKGIYFVRAVDEGMNYVATAKMVVE